MNKEEIRPLLVKNLEDTRKLEESAYSRSQGKLTEEGLQLALDWWRAMRLKRAQAELQLWLADRQWEREETEAREETPTLLPASPITKT
jgi:hypothetical protein